jgi:hypothetical protein
LLDKIKKLIKNINKIYKMFFKKLIKFTGNIVKNLIEDEEFINIVSDVITNVIEKDEEETISNKKDNVDVNVTSGLIKLKEKPKKNSDKLTIIQNISENGIAYYEPYLSNIKLSEKQIDFFRKNFSNFIQLFKKNKELDVDLEILQDFIDMVKSILLNKTSIIVTADSLRFFLNEFLNIVKNMDEKKLKKDFVYNNPSQVIAFLNKTLQIEYKVKKQEKDVLSTIIPKVESLQSKIDTFIDNKLIEKFNVYFVFYSFIVNILFLNFSKFKTKKNKQLEIMENILIIAEDKCDKITNFNLNKACRDKYELEIIEKLIRSFIEILTSSKKLDLLINYRVMYNFLQIIIDILKINKARFPYESKFMKWLLSICIQILHIYGIVQIKDQPYSLCYVTKVKNKKLTLTNPNVAGDIDSKAEEILDSVCLENCDEYDGSCTGDLVPYSTDDTDDVTAPPPSGGCECSDQPFTFTTTLAVGSTILFQQTNVSGSEGASDNLSFSVPSYCYSDNPCAWLDENCSFKVCSGTLKGGLNYSVSLDLYIDELTVYEEQGLEDVNAQDYVFQGIFTTVDNLQFTFKCSFGMDNLEWEGITIIPGWSIDISIPLTSPNPIAALTFYCLQKANTATVTWECGGCIDVLSEDLVNFDIGEVSYDDITYLNSVQFTVGPPTIGFCTESNGTVNMSISVQTYCLGSIAESFGGESWSFSEILSVNLPIS